MSNTAAILAAMSGMQSNAQSSLPFTPNNGNPGGAYNMPQGQATQQPAAPPDPWPWLQPSPFMQTLQQDLMARSQRLAQEIEAANAEPIIPVQQALPVQQPVMQNTGLDQSMQPQAAGPVPIIPIRNQMVM